MWTDYWANIEVGELAKDSTPPPFCVHILVCVGVYVHVHGRQRSTLVGVPQEPSTLFFF